MRYGRRHAAADGKSAGGTSGGESLSRSIRPVAAAGVIVLALAVAAPAAGQTDLSGRWQLNGEQSDDAREQMQQLAGGQGGGLQGLLANIDPEQLAQLRAGRGQGQTGGRGQFDGIREQLELMRGLMDAPAALLLIQDAERLSITDPEGQVRRVPVEAGVALVNGREVRTRWEGTRLVSETIVSETITVTDTYERSPETNQLIITTSIGMQGRPMSIRRVYDRFTD
jgi:hypothetical protein